VIDVYKRDIDRSLLRENLELSPEDRIRKLAAFVRLTRELRKAGRRGRREEQRKATPCPYASRLRDAVTS
jgi:hypothetical protein